MNTYQQTIHTYQQSAALFASKFDAIRPRIEHITETFQQVRKKNPFVLEVGCGSGKDAQEILKRTPHYLGIDVSAGLVASAQKKSPQAAFQTADITTFPISHQVDIIFAFASLIHLDKQQLRSVFQKFFAALYPSGVVRFSMKHDQQYRAFTNQDEFGTRTYYYYSPQEILALATGFTVIKNELEQFRDQTWIEMLLQKPA